MTDSEIEKILDELAVAAFEASTGELVDFEILEFPGLSPENQSRFQNNKKLAAEIRRLLASLARRTNSLRESIHRESLFSSSGGGEGSGTQVPEPTPGSEDETPETFWSEGNSS